MKFATYTEKGYDSHRFGIVRDGLIVDVLRAAIYMNESEGNSNFLSIPSSLKACLEQWNAMLPLLQKLDQSLPDSGLDALNAGGNLIAKPIADVSLLPPVPNPAVFRDFYVFEQHVKAARKGRGLDMHPSWYEFPVFYYSNPVNLFGHGEDFPYPEGSNALDFELELAIIIANGGKDISADDADTVIGGYTILNDWSARDIQAWEYQPLGPFQAKATATSISPWIVTRAALEPFRTATPERERPLLPYLQEPGPMLYDIDLTIGLTPEGGEETVISRTNYATMYYSAAQQLCHHTISGCPMRVGDLLGSGTISGPTPDSLGALLEMTRGGQEPVGLTGGGSRSFLEDGDTLTLYGAARGDGYRVGFGACSGKVLPALDATQIPGA